MSIEVEMKFKKETPGTFVYQAIDDDSNIPTLYIRKEAYKKRPEKIKIVVNEVQ